MDEPRPLKILRLRAEIGELGGAIHQLRRSGMDSASAELLLTRKRVVLEVLLNAKTDAEPKRTLPATLRHADDHTK